MILMVLMAADTPVLCRDVANFKVMACRFCFSNLGELQFLGKVTPGNIKILPYSFFGIGYLYLTMFS